MNRVAWQAMTKHGLGRWSSNHYTIDSKMTLCGKKMPKVFRNDVFSDKDCQKCIKRRDSVQVLAVKDEEKIARFKEVVAELGGNYVLEDEEHRAWWDAYGDKKNLYIAYGKLSCIGVCLTDNWLYLKI